MVERTKRIRRAFVLYFINRFLCGTHFFALKSRLLRWAGIIIGSHVCIVGPVYFGNVAKISFGDNVWVGTKFSVYGNGEVIIRNNVNIAPEVAILTGSHRVSESNKIRAGEGISYRIIVEDACWIDARATIVGTLG